MDLHSNDFELFGVPERFAQERSQLDARWKDLQRAAHPDMFAAQGASAQRAAMQWSVRINEAYQRLKDPVKRAAYLCELRGAAINAEKNTAMPVEFLMQQMELREALEDAKSIVDLDKISLKSLQNKREQLLKTEHFLDVDNDPQAAALCIRALMFVERFQQDVDMRYEVLGQ